jgi:hypothetical protein
MVLGCGISEKTVSNVCSPSTKDDSTGTILSTGVALQLIKTKQITIISNLLKFISNIYFTVELKKKIMGKDSVLCPLIIRT